MSESKVQSAGGRRLLALALIVVAAGLIGGMFLLKQPPATTPEQTPAVVVASLEAEAINDSEQFIVAQEARMQRMGRDVRNIIFPADPNMFAPTVRANDIATPDVMSVANGKDFAINPEQRDIPVRELKLWRPFLDDIEFFEHSKFYIVRGGFIDKDHFQADVGFGALVYTKRDTWRHVSASQTVTWRAPGADDAEYNQWMIVEWKLESFKSRETPFRLFDDCTANVLSGDDLAEARHSVHDELVLQYAVAGKLDLPDPLWAKYFHVDAVGEHPGLSVVDIDGDGHDDIYITVPETKNRLFWNRGDGTFVERAADFGLDVEKYCTSSIFADFDNDGDLDLMLGRSMRQAMYMRNDGGTFVDATSSNVAGRMPLLVASISAADYNADGLLDVYLCTYGTPPVGMDPAEVAADFLDAEDAAEYTRLYAASKPTDRYLSQPGPPNLLLVNRGGGMFEPSDDAPELWMNSLQATWADYDDDGDPDLYVANDYAPDYLLRNDDGVLVDVTREMGGDAMMGLGMGASWGDYDNDGRQDLYVSNMYSKAGKRITEQIPGVDERLVRSAEGNLLFRNTTDAFEVVSGPEPDDLHVAKAGWSWGGQFGDLNNDGYLDIYVSSGYYTAPPEIATEVDL